MSILFNNLQQVRNTANATEKATFVDITLDMSLNKRDINVSFDEQAIKNALYTLFNTYPGENILRPDLGIDLHKNLFDPMSENSGYLIASKVRTVIAKFEPRVSVEQVNVYVMVDEQMYQVEIIISIPALKRKSKFTGLFNSDRQFIILPET